MKQTFNNLREILTRHKENMPVVVLAEMLAEIDEAESKHEKDCCIWKWRMEDGRKVFRNCLYKADTHIAYAFKYCPYCQKPIKQEVEHETDI